MSTPNQTLEYILKLNQAEMMNGLGDVLKKVEKLDSGMESLEKKLGRHNDSNRKALGLQRGLVNDLTRNLQHLTYWRDKSFNPAAIEKFNKKIKETQSEIAKLQQTKSNDNGGGLSLGSLMRGGSAIAAAYAVYGTAKNAIMMSAKQEGLRNAIRFASGNEQEGNQSLSFLDMESRRMGINKLAMMQGYKTFSGGFLGSATSSDDQRKMFSQINSGVVAMNLTGDDAQGVYLALGQIMSKGKVQAEELRGQIGERIPGAFAIAARAMGVTQKALNKMLDNGEILSDVFMPKFAAEVEKTFGKQVPKASQSLQAAMNRATNASDSLLMTVGDKLSPTVKGLADMFVGAANGISHYLQGSTPLADALRDQQSEFNALVDTLKNANLGTDERKSLIDEIITKYGDYLPKLEKEKDLYTQIAAAQLDANKRFDDKIDIMASGEVYQEDLSWQTKMAAEKRKEQIRLQRLINDKNTGQDTWILTDMKIQAAKKNIPYYQKEEDKFKAKVKEDLKDYQYETISAVMQTPTQDSLKVHSLAKEFSSANVQKFLNTTLPVNGDLIDMLNTTLHTSFNINNMDKTKLNKSVKTSSDTGNPGLNTDASVSGGGGVRNIYVNFKNLVEKQEFSGGIKDNAAQIEKDVSELFVRIVRDSELAIG